jgi:hypothetical protein
MSTVPAQVEFVCPVCHAASTCTIEVPEINWASSDKLSDLLSEDDVVVACSACGAHLEAHAQNTPSLCSITFEEYPAVQVSASAGLSPSKSDEWLNTDVPPNPFEVFMDTYFHVGDILAEYGEGGRGILSHSAHVIHRMVFVQQISALEAYLGDTLAKHVLSTANAISALLAGDKDLMEIKLPLIAINKNPGIVIAKVKEHLQGILYHNLAKVAVLYRLALQVDIWPDNQTKNDLFAAISRRHDYVHRNGQDKDGNLLPKLTRPDVWAALEALRRMVDHIETQCRKPSPSS